MYGFDHAKDKIMQAIEATGTINNEGYLQLDRPLASRKAQRVRIIVLLAETDNAEADDIDAQEWRSAAATNPAFAFLHDAEEDIYSLEDGKPLNDEG